jgi:hypothetical protein
MTTRVHIKIARTFAAALVIAAVAAPGAVAASTKGSHGKSTFVLRYREPGSTGYLAKPAVTIPPRFANFREPGSTGYVPPPTHVNIPAWLTNFREPGSTGWVPTAGAVSTTTGAGGLDWTSALIGGGVVLGLALVSAGALLAVRRRRALAHA